MNASRFLLILCLYTSWSLAYGQGSELSDLPVPHKEFTGKDAELIIAALGRTSAEAKEPDSIPSHGFHLDSIHCSLVPSPRATAICVLIQGNVEIPANRESDLILQKFVRNGATLQLVNGVSELLLNDVDCLTYDVFRGVSKCFFLE